MLTNRIEDIGIEAFLEEKPVAKIVRPLMGALLYPYFDGPESKKTFPEQLPSVSRNMEILVDSLLNILKRPGRAAVALPATVEMIRAYISAQKEGRKKEQYLVYTNLDDRIPFRPEDDHLYSYMISQMGLFANEMIKNHSVETIKKVVRCFLNANYQGTEVFKKHPTTMPRFEKHGRVSLKITQMIDGPYNCCPSLHIAYSVLTYNVAKNVLEFPKTNPELWKSFEQASTKIIRPVLYTKQHSLIDVAFGLLSAKKAFEDTFGMKADLLADKLPEMQQTDQEILYEKIYQIYWKNEKIIDTETTFADVVGRYFQEMGLPKVKPNDHNAYYDLDSGRIIEINRK